MFLLAAAALAAGTLPDRPPPPVVAQATASVRIVAGVRLKFDAPTNRGAPPAHDAKINVDGKDKPARLIEFE